jgi:hypothetical protein
MGLVALKGHHNCDRDLNCEDKIRGPALAGPPITVSLQELYISFSACLRHWDSLLRKLE